VCTCVCVCVCVHARATTTCICAGTVKILNLFNRICGVHYLELRAFACMISEFCTEAVVYRNVQMV